MVIGRIAETLKMFYICLRQMEATHYISVIMC